MMETYTVHVRDEAMSISSFLNRTKFGEFAVHSPDEFATPCMHLQNNPATARLETRI